MAMTDAELTNRARKLASILRFLYFGNPTKKAISQMLKIVEDARSNPRPEASERNHKIIMKRVAEHFTDDELAVMGMDRWGRRVKPWPED
jgi:hypothetical protein